MAFWSQILNFLKSPFKGFTPPTQSTPLLWMVRNFKKERQNTFFVWVFCLDGGLVSPRKSITAPVTAVFSFFFVGFLGPALKNEGTSRSSWFKSNILANPDILWYHVQLNEYEKDPYFLQISKINTEVCLIIQNCKHGCEPEIVQKKSKQKTTQESKQKHFYVHNHVSNSYKTHKSTLLYIGISEENIDLSCIYLAVINIRYHSRFFQQLPHQMAA